MVDYKKMYFKLFNAITDAIDAICVMRMNREENYENAIDILVKVQQETEEMYMDADGE